MSTTPLEDARYYLLDAGETDHNLRRSVAYLIDAARDLQEGPNEGAAIAASRGDDPWLVVRQACANIEIAIESLEGCRFVAGHRTAKHPPHDCLEILRRSIHEIAGALP